MSFNRKLLTAALGVSAVLPSAGAWAQAPSAQESGGLLDEIVVTAQRREEKVQDVPIAISAFSADQLEKLNVTEALSIGKLIPNLLAFNNTGISTANSYYLRGIGNTESIATFDPPVGTYADDVYISRQNGNNLGLFDVDRIEVLRGPQGTLFGRNTTGGAVNIILRKPAEEFGGYFEAGVGQFNKQTVRASVDVPVSDRFLTKFSGYYVKDDGYVSNPVTGEDNLNRTDTFGLRAAFRWLATDSITWDLSAQYIEDNGLNMLNFAGGSGGVAYRNGQVGGPLVPIEASGVQVDLIPSRAGLPPTSSAAQSVEARCAGTITRSRFACTGLRQTGTPLAGLIAGKKQNLNLGNSVENTFITSNIQVATSAGDLSFITGYVDLSQEFAIDFFNGNLLRNTSATNGVPLGSPIAVDPVGGFVIANDGEHKQLSQEIKFTGELSESIRYVAGAYYLDESNKTDFADLFGITAPVAGRVIPLTLVLEDRILENDVKAWAAYTQWDVTFADAFTLTVGGRYTDETKEVAFTPNANSRIATPIASRVSSANLAAAGIPLELNTKLFTPRVAVKYDVNNDINVFASATRGFKSGGWNARGTTSVANQAFNPEKVWSYEAGLRSEWFDRKLRFNVTAFLTDVADLQTPSAFVAPSGAISFITRNFAGFDNQGIEVELIASPVDGLTLFAFLGLQDAKYVDIDPGILTQQRECLAGINGQAGGNVGRCNQGIVNPSGQIADPVRTPDTLTLGGSYVFNLGNDLTLTPNVLWSRTGNNNVGTNGSPPALVAAYDQVDLGLTLAHESAGWSIQANCRNCTNSEQVVSTLSELPYLQDPRSWGINFRYNFGARK